MSTAADHPPSGVAAFCRYNAAASPVVSPGKAVRRADAGIDRHHRAPSTGGLRRLPGAARRGVDGAADAALSQSAARSDRGADLWPRVAARLRQVAAAAVVDDRGAAPGARDRGRVLRAGAARGHRCLRRGVVDRALVAVVIVDGLHYFHYTAAKFNHDVIQLPLWAFASYAFHAGLRHGRLRDWLLLGLMIGVALWAKYFVAVLAAPLALFLLIDRDARKALATPGPWVALVLALVVMTPHLIWLVRNDFLPFAYASARSAPVRGVFDHVLHPLAFAVGQLAFMLPALIIAAAFLWPRPKSADAAATAVGADAFDRRIVTLLTFGPAVTTMVLSALSGRGTIAMWGYPLWLFLGVWIVLVARTAIEPARLARVAVSWAVVFGLFALVFAASYSVLPAFDHRYRAVFYPGDRLADELSRRFRAATGAPLTYVTRTMWDELGRASARDKK